MSAPLDPARCPLCGAANLCAMELARSRGQTPGECWCMQADFSVAPLDALPASKRGLACICQRCAVGDQTREKKPLS